jgi:hypothetical protein
MVYCGPQYVLNHTARLLRHSIAYHIRRHSQDSRLPVACLLILPPHPCSLLQDSALVCRYAVLRAAALKLPEATDLYGSPPLSLTPAAATSSSSGDDTSRGGIMQVAGGDATIQELEARLGGTLGIEVSPQWSVIAAARPAQDQQSA